MTTQEHRMPDIELLPCPLCGTVPVLKRYAEIVGIVCGPDSDCDGSGLCIAFSPGNEESAIATWNRRAEPQSAVPGWQPIETAPKDGTVVDLWVDGKRRTYCYWGLPSHCCGEDGQYCDSDWHGLSPGWVDGFNEARQWEPTHWMPLPAAPSPAKEG